MTKEKKSRLMSYIAIAVSLICLTATVLLIVRFIQTVQEANFAYVNLNLPTYYAFDTLHTLTTTTKATYQFFIN